GGGGGWKGPERRGGRCALVREVSGVGAPGKRGRTVRVSKPSKPPRSHGVDGSSSAQPAPLSTTPLALRSNGACGLFASRFSDATGNAISGPLSAASFWKLCTTCMLRTVVGPSGSPANIVANASPIGTFTLRRFSPLAKNVHAHALGSSADAIPTVARHDHANSCWFDDWNWSALVAATSAGGSSV